MNRFLLGILGVLFGQFAFAELPSPRLDRISPLGGAVGSTVDVTLVGNDLDDVKQLLCDSPGITAKHVKEKTFSVTIAANVEPGTYDLWAVGKHGLSNPRLFAVSKGLSEIAEKSPNGDPATAQLVPINSIINGYSDANREDWFRFAAKKGQRIVIECQSAVLDTTMDANLILTSANGKQLATNGDHNGRDPLIDFLAVEDGEYLVGLFDLTYKGGQPYRLTITDRPHVETIFPRAVQLGKETKLTISGRNLGGKSSAIGELEELTETITIPAKEFDRNPFRFTFHPTGHSVLPTAATCTLVGQQIRGVPMYVSDTAVTREKEPNDTPESAQAITLPAVVAGRFDQARDADWYEFTATEDGNHSFNVYCERIAGRADPYLVVTDDKGNRVAEFDDFGHRMLAFDGHLRDPVGNTNLTKGKKYRVLVQDRYRRGGPRYAYVLTIRKPVPDFFVATIHSQNPGPGGLNLRKGGSAYLDLAIHQTDGYNGTITIEAENLPKGITIPPTTITNTNQGGLIVTCDSDAAPTTGFIKLLAKGQRDGKEFVREVRPHCRVNSSTDYNSSRPMRELPFAILAESAPYSLAFEKDTLEIEAGKKLEAKVKLTRNGTDFKSQVNLLAHSFPGQIKLNAPAIGEGKTEATVTFELQSNTRPGRYSLTVLGQSQVPYQKDQTTPKANTLVTMPAKPMTIIVTAAVSPRQ